MLYSWYICVGNIKGAIQIPSQKRGRGVRNCLRAVVVARKDSLQDIHFKSVYLLKRVSWGLTNNTMLENLEGELG